jgi:hypothetical protein
LGRTRQRERRGSTGRAGRLKVGTRLAIRLRMDGLLLCRSIGHCGHQPHRYGDMLVYIVTEAGDVNPSIMNYIALNYSLEGFSWHFQLYCYWFSVHDLVDFFQNRANREMPISAELLWVPNNIGVAILIIVILYGEWLYPYSNYLPSAGVSLSDLCLSIGFMNSGISIFCH